MEPSVWIDITVNDATARIPAGSTVAAVIRYLGEADPDLMVELNGRYVYPRAYATTPVNPHDRLELINPNFGG